MSEALYLLYRGVVSRRQRNLLSEASRSFSDFNCSIVIDQNLYKFKNLDWADLIQAYIKYKLRIRWNTWR